MKKLLSFIICTLIILSCFVGCGKSSKPDGNTLHFSNSVNNIKKLDGQQITVTGYLSELYSADDNICYLMNIPCQKKPFLSDNSKKLSDTVAVQLVSYKAFEYTDAVVTVTGTLVFEDFTDAEGYQYSYRIKNATYAPAEALDGNAKIWNTLALSGASNEITRMLAYVNFVSSWPECTLEIDDSVSYITPEKTLSYVENGIFGYGSAEGYFDGIISTVEALGKDYSDLIKVIEKAEALAEKAYNALKNGDYTAYTDENGNERYSLNAQTELDSEYTKLLNDYNAFLESLKIF